MICARLFMSYTKIFKKNFIEGLYYLLISTIWVPEIKGDVAIWIENWLKNKVQRVVINGAASRWTPVTSEIPQGSTLYSLILIIFVNDMDDEIVPNSRILPMTSSFFLMQHQTKVQQKLNQDFHQLGD